MKVILALEERSDAVVDAFLSWADGHRDTDAVVRAEVEVLDRDVHELHTGKAPRFSAFAMFWCDDDEATRIVDGRPARVEWARVTECIAYDRSGRADEARRWSGVKKTTFWSPVAGLDAEVWQGRYRNHGLVAREHHRTSARYRQNLVVAASDPSFGAVSELWWTDPEDLVERFYDGPEAERLVSLDASGFVDVTNAWPVVTRQTVLKVPAQVPPARVPGVNAPSR
jgi:hypothetical protein